MLWNLILGLVFLGTNRYGVYVTDECPQESYSCPAVCDVDHKHLPLKECENGKTKQESRSNTTTIQSSQQLYKTAMAEDKSERL